jgi:hypothetical protein
MKTLGSVLVAAAVVLGGASPGGTADDPHARHLIYLHGRIVQAQQSARPRHPRFGYYELREIEDVLRGRGFAVRADIRPESATVSGSADGVVTEVRQLLDSGVPADHVCVVGASMGGAIALLASARLQEPDVRFCILGGCLTENLRQLRADGGTGPIGHVLSIREASDDLMGPCPSWKGDPEPRPGLVAREVVVDTGLSHGFLYRPLPEWVGPVVEWALTGSLQTSSGTQR